MRWQKAGNSGMQVKDHLVIGGIASIFLIPAWGANSLIFLAATTLVDGDHYLDYLYRNRFQHFSLRRAARFNQVLHEIAKRDSFLGLSLCHTVEFLLLSGFLAMWTLSTQLWAAFFGVLFHLGLDLVHEYREGTLFKRALSVIEYIIRWNRMMRSGQNPEVPYLRALRATSAEMTRG